MSEKGPEKPRIEPDDWIVTLAKKIASGHAFTKHGGEFGSISREEFTTKIRQTIQSPSVIMKLEGDRVLYWKDEWDFIVIANPRDDDGGTAFRSRTGRAYLETVE